MLGLKFSRLAGLWGRTGIRYTVFVSFTLSALVAISMTGVTFYLRFSNQIESTRHTENQVMVEQVKQSLNTYLSNMIRLSDAVNFRVIKNTDVASGSLAEQLQLLYNTNSSYVKNIVLFSADGEIVAAAPPVMLKPTAGVAAEPWFMAALDRSENLHFTMPMVQNLFMDADNQYSWIIHLSCSAEITEGKLAKKGVLLIEMRYSGLSEIFRNTTLANDGYIFLMDQNGDVIYHPKHQLLRSGMVDEINLEVAEFRDGEYIVESGGTTFSVIVRTVGYTGWKTVGVIKQTGLTFSGLQNLMFVLIIFFLYFSIIILINSYISDRITNPIKELERSVRQIENESRSAEIYIGGSSEIRQLGLSIQQMVDIMRKLADDIVEEQSQKQKSELDALQAQINPHFLYNTLDILVWMIETEQPADALKIVSALARFFRLSLSGGKNIITVRDELEQVRNYLLIQKMRYKSKFTYYIEAEDNVLELSTIKLVLQPIVENAIYHGMEFMTDDDGEIKIKASSRDGSLYLYVEDNGLGMSQEQADRLLTAQSSRSMGGSGIGLRNVYERISLYYGRQYGVIIQSEPDEGTRVTLHLPAIPYAEGDGHGTD